MEAELYFDTGSNYLEPCSLQYKWFGAVWRYENSNQIIVGYWFGDYESDILNQISLAGRSKESLRQQSVGLIKAYEAYRSAQSKLDWNKRTLFPVVTAFREPWRNVKNGWYILRSNPRFPAHISAVHKTRVLIWLEHTAVCESEEDLQRFIDKVNTQHRISLIGKYPLILSDDKVRL